MFCYLKRNVKKILKEKYLIFDMVKLSIMRRLHNIYESLGCQGFVTVSKFSCTEASSWFLISVFCFLCNMMKIIFFVCLLGFCLMNFNRQKKETSEVTTVYTFSTSCQDLPDHLSTDYLPITAHLCVLILYLPHYF